MEGASAAAWEGDLGRGYNSEEMLPAVSTVVADMVRAEGIAAEINHLHRLARHEYARHVIRCGELLLQQKERMQHGEFGRWIEKHCDFSYPTAARYMAAARANLSRGEISLISDRLFPSRRKVEPSRMALPARQADLTAPATADPAAPVTAPPSVEAMSLKQAIATIRRQKNFVRKYGRLLQAQTTARRQLERAEIAHRNAVASILAVASKIEAQTGAATPQQNVA